MFVLVLVLVMFVIMLISLLPACLLLISLLAPCLLVVDLIDSVSTRTSFCGKLYLHYIILYYYLSFLISDLVVLLLGGADCKLSKFSSKKK